MISCAVNVISTACLNAGMSKLPSSSRNFSRFRLARLHALLSRCMYSLHGLLALMRPDAGHVCHWLIVVSYCIPGSAHSHAARATSRIRSRARTVSTGSPVITALSFQSRSSAYACMNSSVTLTELFAFWYCIEYESLPSRSMSNPASRSARALRSSTALHQMKSRTSGWSTFSTTIFAARRVLPPDLIVPAEASAPRMKLTGPLAVPPPCRCSLDERSGERLIPEPDPPLKMVPSSTYQLRIEDMVSSTARMKHAEHCCGVSGTPTLNHTGELNAAFWVTRRWLSSAENTSASASPAK